MRVTRRSLGLCTLLLLVVPAHACVRARAPRPDRTTPRREVTLSVQAEVASIPADAKELRLWLPVPRDEGAQVLEQLVPDTLDATVVIDRKRGNPALLVVLPRPASTAVARATFRVSRAEQRGPIHAAHPVAHPEKAGDPEVWLADERLTFVDGRVREIASGIYREGMSHTEKARAAFDYVLANMRYSKDGTGWGTGSVAWACDMRYGNCTDFHALFIALLRAGGIPARFRIGFSLPPEEGTGPLAGYHCWAEWWDPGAEGWVPVDVSEAWKHPERKEFLFGNLDHDRIGVSLGRDLVFEGQQGPPLNYFVFPYAEVDGRPVKVATTVTFEDR